MRQSRGFSLLEVLVAFVVVALVLGVAMPLLGQGLRGTQTAERRTLALLHAETRLAELIESPAGRQRALDGELPGGYRWRAEVAALESGLRVGRRDAIAEAFVYRVTVDWPGARAAEAVTLSTVRLKPVEPR